jgi:hypothetical protein
MFMNGLDPTQPMPATPRRRNPHGMVTAEAAVVLPLVAALALLMVYLLSIALTKVTVVDAARDAARSLARGEDPAAAIAQAEATAPDGATVAIARDGNEISVRVHVEAGPPGWLVLPLPGLSVESEATVVAEQPQ